jgi:hypothetical protein
MKDPQEWDDQTQLALKSSRHSAYPPGNELETKLFELYDTPL